MSELIQIASAEIGTEEKPGPPDNEAIVAYAQESGFEEVKSDEKAWCSIFINWCAAEAGMERSGQADARSWLEVGKAIDTPAPGDLVIYWRNSPSSWEGHVGIFLGFDSADQEVFTLGGNQSDRVSIEGYPKERVLGYRRLQEEGSLHLPTSILRKGAKGPPVKKVQKGLQKAGFDPGPVDGAYGPRTAGTVEEFQEAQEGLTVDGIYGPNTRQMMLKAIEE